MRQRPSAPQSKLHSPGRSSLEEAHRSNARQLCSAAITRGKPLGWFEQLYGAAEFDTATIPWADLEPNPHLVSWHGRFGFDFAGQRCLKIGCGLGDDCEYMQSHGAVVTGFDISPTAIAWCRRRFPDSTVQYSVCDLFDKPPDWSHKYDFVLESYTLQVLPPEFRRQAIGAIAECVGPAGLLLVICRSRMASEPTGEMPWPLTKKELESFGDYGLVPVEMDDFHDEESPPVHRFRAVYQRA